MSYLGSNERFSDTSERKVRFFHIFKIFIPKKIMSNDKRKAFSRLGGFSAPASSAGLIVVYYTMYSHLGHPSPPQIITILSSIAFFREKSQEEEVARGELRCLQEAMARECDQVTINLPNKIPTNPRHIVRKDPNGIRWTWLAELQRRVVDIVRHLAASANLLPR